MDRRLLIAGGLTAFAVSLEHPASAQTQAATKPKMKVAAGSRQLQWLRTGDEVGRACTEMAFDGLDITVQPAPGHVDPKRVRTDLRTFVDAVRGHGVTVDSITCPALEAGAPELEDILASAAAAGIKYWSRDTYLYEPGKPIEPQIKALTPGIAKLVKLSEKHGVKMMYRNRAGGAVVGTAIFDLLEILKDFDPRYVGFLYDTGQAALAGGIESWTLGLRAAGPFIAGMSFSDAVFRLRLNVDEGGAFVGAPEQLNNFRPTPNRVNYGGGGQTNPWQAVAVPLGTGMADLPRTAQILKDINFQGPVEIAAGYPNGGAETGEDKITLPRAIVLGALKRDLLTLKAAFGAAGLI